MYIAKYGSWLQSFLLPAALVCLSSSAQAAPTPVDSARAFFQAVGDRHYDEAWKDLSQKSQASIVEGVSKTAHLPAAKVKALFESSDPSVKNGFWDAFRASSKADVVARSGVFKPISADAHSARVSLSGKATLLLTQEHGWKLDLVKSFYPEGYKPQD